MREGGRGKGDEDRMRRRDGEGGKDGGKSGERRGEGKERKRAIREEEVKIFRSYKRHSPLNM